VNLEKSTGTVPQVHNRLPEQFVESKHKGLYRNGIIHKNILIKDTFTCTCSLPQSQCVLPPACSPQIKFILLS